MPAGSDRQGGASIAEFGWRQPLVVDAEGVVIVGATRLRAARQLGLAQVPVHVASDLSPAAARAYRLADNRVGEETSWDAELLPGEICALLELDYDLALTGFDPQDLAGCVRCRRRR